MDPEQFLVKQGWKRGEGLKPGSIKKPLLVKHRKDNKGLGYNPHASEGWWERVFDGHLKSLDVNGNSDSKNGEVSFKVDEEKRRKATSPLYSFFRLGGILGGTLTNDDTTNSSENSKKTGEKPGNDTKTKERHHKEHKSKSKSKHSSLDKTKRSKEKKHKRKDRRKHKHEKATDKKESKLKKKSSSKVSKHKSKDSPIKCA